LGINMGGEDVLPSEKVAWEKELLGVPLSENPFKVIMAASSGNAITSSNMLDAEMDGQKVNVVGQVSSVSRRTTRDQRQYAICTLELVYGTTEVIAWPDVLEKTADLWQEGNLVLVTGRVKVRGDELSVHCDQAKAYSAENGSNGHKRENGNKRDNGADLISNEELRERKATSVMICVKESHDAEEDTHRLREAVRTLLEYPGSDRVQLEISTGGKRVLMDLPVVSTGYTPELRQRLEELLGVGSVQVGYAGTGEGSA